jgi:hypothetical protein
VGATGAINPGVGALVGTEIGASLGAAIGVATTPPLPDLKLIAVPASAIPFTDEAGAINVARVLGRGSVAAITPEQLLEWNPEIIVAEERSFYNALRRNRAWRGLAAVQHKRVYLEPSWPFGWIGPVLQDQADQCAGRGNGSPGWRAGRLDPGADPTAARHRHDPPGVNRLIGLHWLSGLFYPDANQEDLRATVCEFYGSLAARVSRCTARFRDASSNAR